MLRPRLVIFIYALVAIVSVSSASAQLSPGELTTVHSFLEGLDNCRQCHGSDRKEIGKNCLQCHGFMRDEIASRTGMHGKNDYTVCETCHVEHQGRDFKLIYWPVGIEAFDHAETGWLLVGKHKDQACRKCHRADNIKSQGELLEAKKKLDRTYLGLNTDCAGCHFDEHRGQLGNDCKSCHTQDGWKPVTGFDHNKARFVLTGLHTKVECAKCHAVKLDKSAAEDTSYQQFTNLKFNACDDCHSDVHKGRLGTDCTKCHSTVGWHTVQSSNFNHDKTRYPLRGMHAGLQCDKCHGASRERMPKFAACTDCHKDFHRGEFAKRSDGGTCESCHTVEGFHPALFTVAQHNASSFPLVEAHLAVPCTQCHVMKKQSAGKDVYKFKFIETTCGSCHKNPHGKNVDRWLADASCEVCHSQVEWAISTFDHSRTSFALIGKHAAVACRKCHWNSEEPLDVKTVRFVSERRLCEDCHNDPHYDQFATAGRTDCETCHSPDGWKSLKFDHNVNSRFKLDGAHIKVPCAKCHFAENQDAIKFVRYKPIGTDCKDCHSGSELPTEKK